MPGSFLDEIERFLAAHQEVSASRLGMDALRDPSFVLELRRGRETFSRTRERVRAWMADYRAARRRPRRKVAS